MGILYMEKMIVLELYIGISEKRMIEGLIRGGRWWIRWK